MHLGVQLIYSYFPPMLYFKAAYKNKAYLNLQMYVKLFPNMSFI